MSTVTNQASPNTIGERESIYIDLIDLIDFCTLIIQKGLFQTSTIASFKKTTNEQKSKGSLRLDKKIKELKGNCDPEILVFSHNLTPDRYVVEGDKTQNH